jgi:hypothetical protein
MIACKYYSTDVALAIIATGESKSLATDNVGHDALYFARTCGLKFWIRREQAYERRRFVIIGLQNHM